jgi:hypothetical protein
MRAVDDFAAIWQAHRVFDLQRRWATPVPRIEVFDDLNTMRRR